MKIFITGQYETDYNRNMILIAGLKKLDRVEIKEYPYSSRRKADKGELHKGFDWADVVFLPSFTHLDVRFIKKQCSKPVVFDPLISRYLTKVFDYKAVSRFSPRAFKNYLKDWIAFRHADLIFADTAEHKKYFIEKFKIPEAKIKVLYIGINRDDLPLPHETDNSGKFKVGFYGKFIPLQGSTQIVEAAKILADHDDIEFELIGDGFEFKKVRHLATGIYKLPNIAFLGSLGYKELLQKITGHDICLGIFGSSLKADLVIANKVYHYAGFGKAIITKNSKAIREIFTDEEDILLCSTDPEDIAQKILKLKNDEELRKNLGNKAYEKIAVDFHEEKIAQSFIDSVSNFLNQEAIK